MAVLYLGRLGTSQRIRSVVGDLEKGSPAARDRAWPDSSEDRWRAKARRPSWRTVDRFFVFQAIEASLEVFEPTGDASWRQ